VKKPPFYAKRGPYGAREVVATKVDAARFWKRVKQEGFGCWEWSGSRFRSGYGQITPVVGCGWDGASMVAHRVAYALTHGKVPRGLNVMHTCDNPPCCNPAHLVLGTHADNMGDMIAKGRSGREASPVCRRGHQKAIGAQCRVCIKEYQRGRVQRDRILREAAFAAFVQGRLAPALPSDVMLLAKTVGDHRRAFVLTEYFALYGQTHRTLEDIAADLRVTRERVRQLRNTALDRLGFDGDTLTKEFKEHMRFRYRLMPAEQVAA
jgi:hypothetical protein